LHGTTFFLNGLGIFVTARHVFTNELKDDIDIFVLQNLSTKQFVARKVTHLSIHPTADIAIGQLGAALDPMTAAPVNFETAPNCRVSFAILKNGTELSGFGYSKTGKAIDGNLTTFTFNGTWAKGTIEDFHQNGFSMLENSCYQTNMEMNSGCSGGPVFSDGCVVGINSTSFDKTDDTSPLSFITPIAYVLPLQVDINDELITVEEMIIRGAIIKN
jgi:S1-C subfamily serine protease